MRIYASVCRTPVAYGVINNFNYQICYSVPETVHFKQNLQTKSINWAVFIKLPRRGIYKLAVESYKDKFNDLRTEVKSALTDSL